MCYRQFTKLGIIKRAMEYYVQLVLLQVRNFSLLVWEHARNGSAKEMIQEVLEDNFEILYFFT